jgi:hypothetical protein
MIAVVDYKNYQTKAVIYFFSTDMFGTLRAEICKVIVNVT